MSTSTTATAPDYTESEEISRFLTSDQVAHFLDCSPQHILNLRHGGMPAYRIGKIVRFEIDQVKRWLDRNGDSPHAGRAEQLAAIAGGHDDNAECAVADLFKEFPSVTAEPIPTMVPQSARPTKSVKSRPRKSWTSAILRVHAGHDVTRKRFSPCRPLA